MSSEKVEGTTDNPEKNATAVVVASGDETNVSDLVAGGSPEWDLPEDMPGEDVFESSHGEDDEEVDVVAPAPTPSSTLTPPVPIVFEERPKPEEAPVVEEPPVMTPEPVILVPTSVIDDSLDPFGEAEEDEGDLAIDFGVPPVQTAQTTQTSQPIPLTVAPATQTQQPIAQPVQPAPAPPTTPPPNNNAQTPPVNSPRSSSPRSSSPPANMDGCTPISSNLDTTKSFWNIIGIVAGIVALLLVVVLLVLQVKGPHVSPEATTDSTPPATTKDVVKDPLEPATKALDALKKGDGRLEVKKQGNIVGIDLQAEFPDPTAKPTLDQVQTHILKSAQDRAGTFGDPMANKFEGLQDQIGGLNERVAGIESRLDGQDLKLDAILHKLNRPVLDPINPGEVFFPTK